MFSRIHLDKFETESMSEVLGAHPHPESRIQITSYRMVFNPQFFTDLFRVSISRHPNILNNISQFIDIVIYDTTSDNMSPLSSVVVHSFPPEYISITFPDTEFLSI
jgi:hypothetical protein